MLIVSIVSRLVGGQTVAKVTHLAYSSNMAGRPVEIWHRFVPESLVAFVPKFYGLCNEVQNIEAHRRAEQDAYNRAIAEAEQKFRSWQKGKLQSAQQRRVGGLVEVTRATDLIPDARETLKKAIWELLKENAAYAEALKTQIEDDPSALHYEDKTYAEHLGLM